MLMKAQLILFENSLTSCGEVRKVSD